MNYFSYKYFIFFIFRDVWECSGIFDVPGFIDGRVNKHCAIFTDPY